MHVTIYRGPDGLPAWATVEGCTDPERVKAVGDAICDGISVFAFGGDDSVEVV